MKRKLPDFIITAGLAVLSVGVGAAIVSVGFPGGIVGQVAWACSGGGFVLAALGTLAAAQEKMKKYGGG